MRITGCNAYSILPKPRLEALGANLRRVVARTDSIKVMHDRRRLVERKTLVSAFKAGEGAELLEQRNRVSENGGQH